MNETFGGKQQLFIERLKNKYQLYCIIVTSCFHDDKGVRFVLFCCCFLHDLWCVNTNTQEETFM